MTVLDCESFESALQCVSDEYSSTPQEIRAFLVALNLEREYGANRENASDDDRIVQLFERGFGSRTQIWESVYWFHLTRVQRSTDFSEGILPLNLALDKIWQTILSIPRDPQVIGNLRDLRRGGALEEMYDFKVQNQVHFGPHAMLVRKAAFEFEAMGNKDFLGSSEIVEHICKGYEERFGASIHKEISAGLTPCIVKFEAKEVCGSGLLKNVLHYCWCEANQRDLHLHANNCYDGHGQTIPHSAIRKVQFLQDHKRPNR